MGIERVRIDGLLIVDRPFQDHADLFFPRGMGCELQIKLAIFQFDYFGEYGIHNQTIQFLIEAVVGGIPHQEEKRIQSIPHERGSRGFGMIYTYLTRCPTHQQSREYEIVREIANQGLYFGKGFFR